MEYMSWCGGGEIRPTPGVEFLVRAMSPCAGKSQGVQFWADEANAKLRPQTCGKA